MGGGTASRNGWTDSAHSPVERDAVPLRTSVLLTLTALATGPSAVRGQGVDDALGAALVGVLVSVPVTLGYSAFRAQSGDYVWNGRDVGRRVAVVGTAVVGISVGVALASGERFDVGDALVGAGVGAAAGALVGAGVAQLTSSTPEGRWCGMLMGLGAGALVGSVWATVSGSDGESVTAPALAVRLPVALPVLAR